MNLYDQTKAWTELEDTITQLRSELTESERMREFYEKGMDETAKDRDAGYKIACENANERDALKERLEEYVRVHNEVTIPDRSAMRKEILELLVELANARAEAVLLRSALEDVSDRIALAMRTTAGGGDTGGRDGAA